MSVSEVSWLKTYPFKSVRESTLSEILAATAMSFSSVSVIANSLRLRRVKL
jgi:cation transport ATPase